MIRHRTQGDAEAVSFFPLMSVLCCTLGALVFVLMGITLAAFRGAKQVVTAFADSDRPADAGRPILRPVCVECREKVLILHPEGKEVLLSQLPSAGEQSLPGAYGGVLNRLLSHRGEQYLLLLIRPNGFATFQRAMALAVASGGGPLDATGEPPAGGFAIGYELVLRPGPIELPEEIGER